MTTTATHSCVNSRESEVTLNDQKLINRFARLNAKCEELSQEINGKKRQLVDVEEAINELMLIDGEEDDEAYVLTGEVFTHFKSTSSASDLCEEKKKSLEKELKEIQRAITTMAEEMSTIKVKLYSKFGNNINLEYDDN